MTLWPGEPLPLGASYDGEGVNFALYSEHAAGVELCLFDTAYDPEPSHTIELADRTGPVFHGYVPGLKPRQRYGYRVHGPYEPAGATLDPGNPYVLQLIMDSLRSWVQHMHVDGFRFDLAAALARELYDVGMLSPFFKVIQQDPVLSSVKLIAEPWDVGPGGYQVGNFPWRWCEWNGRYRDAVRGYWRGVPRRDCSFLVLFHGRGGGCFTLPAAPEGDGGVHVLDTVQPRETGGFVASAASVRLAPAGLSVYQACGAAERPERAR